MVSEGSLTRYGRDLYSRDARRRNEAATQIWLRFVQRLRSVVRHNLDPHILRKAGGDDGVLQSMFASFFAAEPGPKGPPRNRAELWRLLAHFTMCKVANTAEHHRARKRDVRRESPTVGDDRGMEFPDRRQRRAEDLAIARQEFTRLLAVLPEDLHRVFVLRLEGHTNAEIAARLGRVERTIELKMRAIRGLLRPHLDLASGDGTST